MPLFPTGGWLPVGGQKGRQVVLVAHRRQAAEHVAQIRQRIDSVATAGKDYRVAARRP